MSNNGKQFDNAKFRDFCAELGIKNYYSSPAHPQSNGQAEVTIRTLKAALKTKLEEPCPTLYDDEFVYSGQVTLPKESDQLRLYRHSAPAPGATQLTLTSSSTLDRSRYLSSQISSSYIATRPQRPEPRSSP